MLKFETKKTQQQYDYLAPDGSEIRLCPTMKGGGLCDCTLPKNCISKTVKHKTVEEIWFVLEGEGEVWRKQNETEEVVKMEAGVSLPIPVGTHFQFRNTGDRPLRLIIVTMPPWPGSDEAVRVSDFWAIPEQ